MEALYPCLKKLWIEWQLQTLVLLSLLLQVILILLGNRRKFINKIWIKIIVWPAYLLADFIATTALGVLTNQFAYHSGPLDAKLEMTAFWAPFLLLHLGGPDTITAYSMEDNELWLRHLLQLVGQTGIAFYILSAGWTGSHVSFLTIPIMLAGLIKYGERTWVLWSSSYEQRRKASVSPHHNMLQSIADVKDYSVISDDKLLQVSYGMFEMAKSLFAGVPITVIEQSMLANHQEVTSNILEKISPKDAFKVIEIQLGFMYDLLYTKALVSYTPCGIVLRITSSLLTSIVLVLFSLAPHNIHKYSKVDLYITFSLLVVAIVLELYAALALLLADHTSVWLRKHNIINISRAITSFPPLRNHRWSNCMGQYNFLSYFSNEKPVGFCGNLKLFKINQKLEKQPCADYRPVPEDLKEWLVMHSKKFRDGFKKGAAFRNMRGAVSLGSFGNMAETVAFLSTIIEFHQTIVVWHIATELCYHLDHDYFSQKEMSSSASAEIVHNAEYIDENERNVVLNRKMSKRISRYMMYLLAISPETLPASGAIGQINFKSTFEEYMKEIASFESMLHDQGGTKRERKHKIKIEASEWLYDWHKDLITNRDQMVQQLSGSLLSSGCVLAKDLIKSMQDEPEGEVITYISV